MSVPLFRDVASTRHWKMEAGFKLNSSDPKRYDLSSIPEKGNTLPFQGFHRMKGLWSDIFLFGCSPTESGCLNKMWLQWGSGHQHPLLPENPNSRFNHWKTSSHHWSLFQSHICSLEYFYYLSVSQHGLDFLRGAAQLPIRSYLSCLINS